LRDWEILFGKMRGTPDLEYTFEPPQQKHLTPSYFSPIHLFKKKGKREYRMSRNRSTFPPSMQKKKRKKLP
jgi:hypothetical protein